MCFSIEINTRIICWTFWIIVILSGWSIMFICFAWRLFFFHFVGFFVSLVFFLVFTSHTSWCNVYFSNLQNQRLSSLIAREKKNVHWNDETWNERFSTVGSWFEKKNDREQFTISEYDEITDYVLKYEIT